MTETTALATRTPDWFPLDLAVTNAIGAGVGALIGASAAVVLCLAASGFFMVWLWRVRVRRGDLRRRPS